jgi:hypothetical protein
VGSGHLLRVRTKVGIAVKAHFRCAYINVRLVTLSHFLAVKIAIGLFGRNLMENSYEELFCLCFHVHVMPLCDFFAINIRRNSRAELHS